MAQQLVREALKEQALLLEYAKLLFRLRWRGMYVYVDSVLIEPDYSEEFGR